MIRRLRTSAVLSLVLVAALASPPALADGAFPDSLAIYAYPDRPHEIIVTTNFGLLVSEDDGRTWRWTCEEAILSGVLLYQGGAAPEHPLYALAPGGASVTVDDACSWTGLGPPLDAGYVADLFPDPTDEPHAFALGAELQHDELQPLALYETHDTGATFQRVAGLPADTDGSELRSVESARTNPQVVYVTRELPAAGAVDLLRSDDGGRSWTTYDLTAVVGPYRTAIAAVDPADAQTIYLRTNAKAGDLLAISHDGGKTVNVALQLDQAMSAFLRRKDGSLVVGTKSGDQFLSPDGGQTFAKWTTAPHLRAIVERDGTLYGAADEFRDGFLVGESTDDGRSWKGLLTYEQICAVPACVASACTDALNALRLSLGLGACGKKATTPQATPPRTGCQCGSGPAGLLALAALGLRRRRCVPR